MRRFFFGISLLLIALLLPTETFAFDIAGAIGSIFAKLFGLIATILNSITGMFLAMAVGLFNLVASDNFISLSYTNAGLSLGDPNFNPFLNTGWTLTRDLTNIFFVLALVFIGLGTALRLTGFQAQKALPILIIIALLINFTPVILGLIVDASNIVMNFFLRGGLSGSNSFYRFAMKQLENPVLFDVRNELFWNPMANTSAAMGSIVLIFFNLIAGIIYLLFAFIFILRYIAIWTLVILSPLAFVCRIFPQSMRFWNQWWQQFIQWSFVGAIAAFFLYLGDHFIKTMTDTANPVFTKPMSEISNAPGLAQFMGGMLPYFVSIVFLFIGLILSLTFSPAAASAVIKGGEKGMQKTGKAIGAFSAGVARGIPAVNRLEAAARQRLERTPILGRAIGGPGTYATQLDKERKEAGKKLETLPPNEIRRIMQITPITKEDRLRRARGLEILAEKNLINNEDQRHIPEALRFGVSQKAIYDKLPNLDPNIRQRVEGMDVEEFRKNILPHAFETPPPIGSAPGTPPAYTNQQLDVFYSMDLTKVQDLGLRGKKAQRRALRNLTDQRVVDINNRITALRTSKTAANMTEADKIENMWLEVQNNPNYIT